MASWAASAWDSATSYFPVSTLVKWFPDRPGMATGMAIMGFGGGALVGAPFGVELMNHFKSATSVGVQESFLAMAACYFVMMNIRHDLQ